MKKYLIGLVITASLMITGCSFFENCVEGEGEIVEQTIDLETFNEINLMRNTQVFLKQGNSQSVQIEAPQNIIDLLLTKVEGKTWEIDFSRCPKTEEPIKIHIQTQNLEEITIEGSGEVYSEEIFETDELHLDITGSGSIEMNLKVKELQTEINGAGDIKLQGETKLHDIEINGSGDIKAYELLSNETGIEINGSGDVKVNVSYSLEVEINGSGDVYYKGNVKEISSEINGSGKLNQKD